MTNSVELLSRSSYLGSTVHCPQFVQTKRIFQRYGSVTLLLPFQNYLELRRVVMLFREVR